MLDGMGNNSSMLPVPTPKRCDLDSLSPITWVREECDRMVARGEKALNSSIFGVHENFVAVECEEGDDLEYALIRLAASAVLTLEAIRKGERI